MELVLGVDAEDPAVAGRGAGQPEQGPDRGGLSRAVRTEEPEHTSGRHAQVQSIDRHGRRSPETAVLLAETLDLDHRRRPGHRIEGTTRPRDAVARAGR